MRGSRTYSHRMAVVVTHWQNTTLSVSLLRNLWLLYYGFDQSGGYVNVKAFSLGNYWQMQGYMQKFWGEGGGELGVFSKEGRSCKQRQREHWETMFKNWFGKGGRD